MMLHMIIEVSCDSRLDMIERLELVTVLMEGAYDERD